jgi:LAS seventeen-binding protein 5
VTEKDVEEVQQGLEAVHVSGSEVQRLQERQRAAVQRAVRQRSRQEDDTLGSPIHPDLHDLSFGELGPEHRYDGLAVLQPLINRHRNRNLQPPIRPTAHLTDGDQVFRRGSLSDFSNYESSDEETYGRAGQSSGRYARTAYINVSEDDEDAEEDAVDARPHIAEDEDPFADPFAD